MYEKINFVYQISKELVSYLVFESNSPLIVIGFIDF